MTGRTAGWVVMVAGMLCMLSAAAAGEKKPLPVGSQAPNFFIPTYNPKASGKKRVYLDKLVGDKAVEKKKLLLVSFFNIDCKPCRKELPFLQKLYTRYENDGLGVLVINCDFKKDKIEQVVNYVQEQGFTYPVLKDRFQALQRRYSIGSFPTMYFLDGQGLIVDVRVGYNEEKKPFPLADVQKRLGVKQEPLGEASAPPPRPAEGPAKGSNEG